MKFFGRKRYYIDSKTEIPPQKQNGSKRKPYGSFIQLSARIKNGQSVKVVLLHFPGTPTVDFKNDVARQKGYPCS